MRPPGAIPCPQTERRDSTKDAARAGGARTRTRASRPRGPSLPPRDPGPGGAARRAPGQGAPSLRGPGSWPSRRAQLGAQLGWRRRPGDQGAQSVRTQGSLRDRWPGRAAAEPSPPLRSPCPFPFLLGALLPTCARGAPRSVSRSPPSCTLRRAPHTSGSRGSGRRPTGPSGPSARRWEGSAQSPAGGSTAPQARGVVSPAPPLRGSLASSPLPASRAGSSPSRGPAGMVRSPCLPAACSMGL